MSEDYKGEGNVVRKEEKDQKWEKKKSKMGRSNMKIRKGIIASPRGLKAGRGWEDKEQQQQQKKFKKKSVLWVS